jgi:hypothetical protein
MLQGESRVKKNETSAAVGQEESEIIIGVAATPEEKRVIYHFRYCIYAEEMLKSFPNMDHANKLLYDEMDEWGILLYAKVGSKIIGTARINIGRPEDFPRFWSQNLPFEKFKGFDEKALQKFAYSSKVMIAQEYRNSLALYLLMLKVYEFSYTRQVQFNFGVCSFHLLPLYEQFGFRRLGKNLIDPGYGLLASLILLIDDLPQFKAVRSPFFRIARKRESLNNCAVKWFNSEFPETQNIINSQLVTEEQLWTALCNRLGNTPDKAISILNLLSETEAKKLLHHCGVVVQCYAGDRISTEGDTGNELDILLSGKLQSSSIGNISPGQHFGESGLLGCTKYISNITAMTDAEILVLSFHSFQKLRKSCPEIANKVLQNLAG